MADLNAVVMRFFHWYTPGDGAFRDDVAGKAKGSAAAGIDALRREMRPSSYREPT